MMITLHKFLKLVSSIKIFKFTLTIENTTGTQSKSSFGHLIVIFANLNMINGRRSFDQWYALAMIGIFGNWNVINGTWQEQQFCIGCMIEIFGNWNTINKRSSFNAMIVIFGYSFQTS